MTGRIGQRTRGTGTSLNRSAAEEVLRRPARVGARVARAAARSAATGLITCAFQSSLLLDQRVVGPTRVKGNDARGQPEAAHETNQDSLCLAVTEAMTC